MARKILLLALAAFTWGCDTTPQRAPTADAAGREISGRDALDAPTVLFIGTSLTAGMGLEIDQAYPALVQRKIDAAGLRFRVVNAGVSGETSAGGLRRIDWLLREPVAVLVVELGANDGLRGLDPQQMKRNLEEIIARTRAANPDVRVVLAGMEAPPNLGRRYTGAFRRVFVDLAREQDATLIPFLLDRVGAVPQLNQADGIHPTAEGQAVVAENVWQVLEPVLREVARRREVG
jgi:acyl-CoA thioesterase-1